MDLMLLGVGAIIGTGIFVLTGQAAADNAGPAVVLSFVAAGIASGFAGLCYSEMASMIPIAGSAYTYSYATMGELVAWIIGWDLILEYMVASAAVSVGWSGYAVAFVHDVLGITLSPTWTRAPFVYDEVLGQFHSTGAVLNIPAMLITAVVTTILVIGIKESARFNARHRHHQGRGGADVHRLLRAVREHRQLAPVHPARSRRAATSDFRASCAARPGSSSPTSGSTPSRPPRRRPRTRSAICRSGSSDRWPSARSSTWRSP